MEAIEALIQLADFFKKRESGEPRSPGRPAAAPAPPVTVRIPRPPAPPPGAARPPAAPAVPAAPAESLVPFAGGDSRAIVRAIIASEVLAPPLALRDGP